MCIVVLSRENIVKVSKREECVCVGGYLIHFTKLLIWHLVDLSLRGGTIAKCIERILSNLLYLL